MRTTPQFRTTITIIAILAISILTITGCTGVSVPATGKLALEAKLADMLIQSGAPVDTVITANLTEAEIDGVIQAVDTYQVIREKWQSVTDNPVNMAANILLLSNDYANLYGEYKSVRAIVAGHWDEYTPGQQLMLASYHAQAVSIHNAVQEFLANNQRTEAVDSMLELGLMVAKIALV